MRRYLFPLILAFLAAACAPAVEPIADPQAAMQTMVAATVAAMPTRTLIPLEALLASPTLRATLVSTWTPFPSVTPFPSLTTAPTSTVLATATLVAGSEYQNVQGSGNFSCLITKQLPEDWQVYPPSGRTLAVVWEVQNVGLKDWNNQEVSLDFLGGERMVVKGTSPQLLEPILAGQTGVIVLNFVLPTRRNRYVSRWALLRGRDPFCEFSFQVTIK